MKSRREHRHCSIVYLHGTPISFGMNSTQYHAEENAIYSIPYYKKDKRSLVMVNLRLTSAGKIGLSKPCLACLDLLRERKFRKVIYSTNGGKFEEIYL